MALTSRERVLKAITHEEPDRVPIDLGGCNVTTFMAGPYRELCEYMQIKDHAVYMPMPASQTVLIGDPVIDEFGGDTKWIPLMPKKWYQGRAYDGSAVYLPEGFRPESMPDGSQVLRDAQGNVAKSLPAGGYFFDTVRHPLQDITTVAAIERARDMITNFDRPAWSDLDWNDLARHAKKVRESSDKILIGAFIGHIFQAGQLLRGWSEFMMDLVGNPSLAEALLDQITDAHIRAFDRYADTVGKYVDVVLICDDLGMQSSMWMSPETYRKRVKPYQAKLYRFIKQRCDAFLMLHSDGSLYPIIPDLIEIGVDILNPVQYTSRDMGLAKLKKDFGRDLCFWGAGFDTQTTMPFGTPQEVSEEVKRNISIMAPGGGFVFASVHNLTEGVPVENIIAAYRTAAEYGKY